MQVSLSLAFVMLAATVRSSNFLPLSLSVFFLIAILSATHDVALDGYYILALAPKRQAFFVGIRSTFFRLAMVFCSGALVICAGQWERSGVSIAESWKRAIWIGAVVYTLLTIYESRAMPRLSRVSDPASGPLSGAPRVSLGGFTETFRSFFAQPGIFRIISFFLLYRFSEAMLTKVSGLFLLDKHVAGGLEFSTVEVGAILGNVGVASLVVGGILGGFVVSKFGLRRSFWPIAITMTLPNFLYLWAARAQIGPVAMSVVTAGEQFSYGFGMAPYLIYAMDIAGRSRFKTSHYAILSGFIALGAMIAGIASGYLQVHLGYFGLFVLICLSSIPGMVLLKFIPLSEAVS
jgi:PAT family beta-lactamase induction signal transducer AmpG